MRQWGFCHVCGQQLGLWGFIAPGLLSGTAPALAHLLVAAALALGL